MLQLHDNHQGLFQAETKRFLFVPADWDNDGNFQFLRTLSLGDNQLNGSLPANWGTRMNLTSFNASYNQFSGGLPEGQFSSSCSVAGLLSRLMLKKVNSSFGVLLHAVASLSPPAAL